MEIEKEIKKEIKTVENLLPKVKIHAVLAYSYATYFFVFLAGIFFDFLFPIKYLKQFNLMPLGFFLMIFGSFLVLWAQRSSVYFNKIQKENKLDKNSFKHGPYRFTRNPTHFGLTFLMIGFGMLANTPFTIFFTIIYFFIGKILFIKKEEDILAKKYGDLYLEYKNSVRF